MSDKAAFQFKRTYVYICFFTQTNLRIIIIVAALTLVCFTACTQTAKKERTPTSGKTVGGRCEGCTNGYWIDEYLFEGDPYLTDKVRKVQQRRGGNGIIKLKTGKNGLLIAGRDIILGLNVPDYE